MALEELVNKSLDVILNVVEKCGGFERLAISFNGGKDCTALLFLLLRAAKMKGYEGKLKVAYVRTGNPFPEMEAFIHRICKLFSQLALSEYSGASLKEGFEKFIQETGTKAILIGTRETDPYGSRLMEVMETDNGWPSFLRVHPILRWSYQDIWSYLLTENIPYCELYDQGYTSIGDRDDSRPNELLRRLDGTFRPAHELEKVSTERSSRT